MRGNTSEERFVTQREEAIAASRSRELDSATLSEREYLKCLEQQNTDKEFSAMFLLQLAGLQIWMRNK